MLDQTVISQLMSSTLYKQIEQEADQRRVEAHRAALAAIAEHEKASQPAIEKARKELLKAEAEFKRIEPQYTRARNATLAAGSVVQELEFSAGHTLQQLQGRLDEHLLPAIMELERALLFAGNELRGAYRIKQSWEPMPFNEGKRTHVATNQGELERAQAQLQSILEYCRALRTKPAPADEIMETLARELGELRSLARVVGVEIDPHLPGELKQPHGPRERAEDYRAIVG